MPGHVLCFSRLTMLKIRFYIVYRTLCFHWRDGGGVVAGRESYWILYIYSHKYQEHNIENITNYTNTLTVKDPKLTRKRKKPNNSILQYLEVWSTKFSNVFKAWAFIIACNSGWNIHQWNRSIQDEIYTNGIVQFRMKYTPMESFNSGWNIHQWNRSIQDEIYTNGIVQFRMKYTPMESFNSGWNIHQWNRSIQDEIYTNGIVQFRMKYTPMESFNSGWNIHQWNRSIQRIAC